MPMHLPPLLLLKQLAQQTAVVILFALRAVLIAIIWLGILPWATIWTWRMFFTVGDSTAWWISSRPRPYTTPVFENGTLSTSHNQTTDAAPWPISWLSHPTIVSVSADIVSGQIIATVIVVAFVAVFLLREWISQNARPGVFDDAEGPPPEPQEIDLPPHLAHMEAVMENQTEQALREREAAANGQVPPTVDLASDAQFPDTTNEVFKGKGKGKDLQPVDWDAIRAEMDDPNRNSWGDALEPASTSDVPLSSEPSIPISDTAFPVGNTTRFAGNTAAPQLPADWMMNFSSWNPTERNGGDAPVGSGANVDPPTQDVPQTPQTPSNQRPPLFSTALLPSRDSISSSRLSESRSRGSTPLASPSLATYCAPEELNVGSSSQGYFNQNEQLDHGHADAKPGFPLPEYDRYFQEPSSSRQAEPSTTPTRQDSLEMPPLEPMADRESDEEWDFGEDEETRIGARQPPPPPFDPMDPFRDDIEAVDGEDEQGDDMREPDGEARGDFNDGEEGEIGMEDDMEGALEAIGLRGPIHAVVQNVALMIFVLNATIGIGIWLPFTIGKSLALLSLDPKRLLYVLHFPIRAIRIITDPVVDSFMFFLLRVISPLLWRAVQPFLGASMRALSGVLGVQNAEKGIESLSIMLNRSAKAAVTAWTSVITPVEASTPTQYTLVDKLFAPNSAFMRVAEPYFAPIGEMVRLTWDDLKASWVKLALGGGTTEKIFAILLGYMVNAFLLAIYLNILTVGSMKNAGRAVRSAVRQQLLVVKVATFIIVELVVFPLGCGIMLDVCTVSLFPQGSWRGRLAFFVHAPLTSAFYHWVIGTMFMYQFAVLLAAFRACLRAGALWFIKDPQDQNFHPIREILDRPALVHVRKLIVSGLMYGCVIAFSVGTVSTILRIFSRTIMPFRWKLREPLSVVPIDLLFLHLVLPYTMQYFRPRKLLKQNSVHVWKFLAAQLRLSSYLFGGRHPEEEVDYMHSLVFGPQTHGLGAARAGTFRRVPNSDNIALVKGQSATVQVDEEGRPVNPKELRLMQVQDAEAEKNKRNVKDDYTIVYMPPYFRYRVFAFIGAVWTICSLVLASALAIPVLVGRIFFKLFVPHQVHDGYAFVAGFYLLWTCLLVSTAVDRMDRHRQRRGAGGGRADLALYFVKRSVLWGAQATYMALSLGVVIPILIAVVVELYVILPVRHELHPEVQPRIRIVDMWALGLIFTKVLLRVQRVQPMGQIARGVDAIRRNGWTNPDPIKATKEVIGPLTVGLLGMILLPPTAVWAALRITGLKMDETFILLHVYPGICTFTATVLALRAAYEVVNSWSQTVRDKEFLVEMRLQNLELDQETREKAKAEEMTDGSPVEEDE